MLDLHRIRASLPSVEQQVFLNTGTAGPLPQATAAALREGGEHELHRGRAATADFLPFLEHLNALRAAMAAQVGADPDEIALTHNTSEGMNIVSWGLDWRRGDEILLTNIEHEGGLLPAYQLHHRLGVRVVFADTGEGEANTALRAIERAFSPRTRLLVLSHVSFSTGATLPLQQIIALAHRHHVPVLVDGAQSIGAIPVDMHALHADYYAFPGQKWLLGPEGTGGLYVRRDLLSSLEVTYTGFFGMNMLSYGTHDPHHFSLGQGASRYEVASVYRPGVAALLASLGWLRDEVTPSGMYGRIADLTRYCRESVQSIPGAQVLTPKGQEAGLINFRVDGVEPPACVERLAEQGIIIRHVPDNMTLRISCGFYNTQDEIDRTCRAIRDLAQSS